MSQPTRGSLDDRENESFEEVSGRIYKATFTKLDPSQFPIPVDTSGISNPALSIITAVDVIKTISWADWNSRKLRRVISITYTAASISATSQVLDTFTYTLSAGEYMLDAIVRTYTP